MKIRKGLLLSLWTTFCFTTPGHAALNDVAIFAPGAGNWMTVQQQNDVATYLTDSSRLPLAQVYNYANQGNLASWMNSRMSDGKSDVLLIVDLAPSQVFNDNDNSLAETWMENGNMLIWTGSEPFRSSVDAGGTITDLAADGVNDGASKVLDVKGENLCTGYASTPQQHTSVATATSGFYNYLPSLNLNYTGSDMRSLSYVDVLTEAENVATWDDAPHMVIDEMFAENNDASDTTHIYESDAIVLTMRETESDRKGNGGQYAQFYCYKGLIDGVDSNEYRKPVLAEFLQNWVAKDIDLIWVQAGATGGDGSEANPYGKIQDGINAAESFSRDRVMVKTGTYYESLEMKRSVKLISVGEDERMGAVGYIDDLLDEFTNPELNYTYNTFSQVEGKKGLTRAKNTILDGTGQQQLCFNGGGNPAICPMVDIPKWATLGTWVDGFTVQNMEEVNHIECGHAHALQTRGSSATLIDNIIWHNGSGGLGSHSMFNEENICENKDFRYSNVKYDAHPALINNIVGESNGPNLGNNHYSYAIMYHNEAYKSGYYKTGLPMADHEAPGIGNQHGAHAYIYKNVVYDSAWTGIGAKRGKNNNTATIWQYNIDRPTRPIVKDNYVFNSGKAQVEDFGAGIGGSNTGGPDIYSGQDLYHVIDHNFVFSSQDAAIGIRYWEEEDGEGTSVSPETGYVIINNNTGTEAGKAGIGIDGAYDVAEISHNEVADNGMAGIGIKNEASVGDIADNSSHNNEMAGIGMKNGAQVAAIINNSLLSNTLAGIGHDGSVNRVVVGEESGNTIEWNLAAGIGMIHSEVGLMSMNTIRFNALPGITVTEDSDVALIEGSASTEGPERVSENGRGDLHDNDSSYAGLVVLGEGSTANISNLIVEKNGTVNIVIHPDTVVTINNSKIRENEYGPNVEVTGMVDITNSLLENSNAPGLAMFDGATVSLENTTITNSGTVGIVVGDESIFTSFKGNTITENTMTGLSIFGHGGDLKIENSFITKNGTTGLLLEEMNGELVIENTVIAENGTPGLLSSGSLQDITFTGGEIRDNGTLGIKVNDSSNLSMTDVLVSGNGARGIWGVNSNLTLIDSVVENYNLWEDDRFPKESVVTVSNSEFHDVPLVVNGGQSVTVSDSLFDSWVFTTGISLKNVDDVSISGNHVEAWSIGIYLEGVGWFDVVDNYIESRWPMDAAGSTGTVVNNVTGPVSDGYLFRASTVSFHHNTFFGGTSSVSGRTCVKAIGPSTVDFYNNIITGAQYAVIAQSGGLINADYNLQGFCQLTYSTWFGTGTVNWGVNNMFNVDPKLVDPANNDFHLQSSSPAIDAGLSGLGVTNDMDGEGRPMGNGYDIGADEAI